MKTNNAAEIEDNNRLSKSEKNVEHCLQSEADAIRALAAARADLARAREKHAQLFQECETRAVARRKAGLITVEAGY